MLEQIVPLDPIDFFAFQLDCFEVKKQKLENKHLLPDLSSFHDSRSFAEVAIGWHVSGIYIEMWVDTPFNHPDFPDFGSADSIELFFDTRDVKTTGFTTRFCHHFFFLPEPFTPNGETIQAGEVTRFRTDDVHELCDPSLLQISSESQKKKKHLHIFIPSECLHGYDPAQFDRLGFTYRLNRINGEKQNFAAGDANFTIESQPSLWASLKLVR